MLVSKIHEGVGHVRILGGVGWKKFSVGVSFGCLISKGARDLYIDVRYISSCVLCLTNSAILLTTPIPLGDGCTVNGSNLTQFTHHGAGRKNQVHRSCR
jgi:hypothetical protein